MQKYFLEKFAGGGGGMEGYPRPLGYGGGLPHPQNILQFRFVVHSALPQN